MLELLIGLVVLVAIAGYLVFRNGVNANLDLRYASPPKVPTPKVEEVDLSKMTKAQIEVWARDNLDLELDRRRTKAAMIEEVENTFRK
jgi:hypothetical protein